MKKTKKRIFKVVGWVLISLVVAITLGPFLIDVNGAKGIEDPAELATDNGRFITLPFEGTDGIDTYYVYKESKGNNDKNFILLHGSLYNSNTWNDVIEYLSTKGNVYAYDQIPYGLSEKLLEGDWTGKNPYTINAATEQLKIFMDELGIDNATLVGSSFGGVIAAEAALKYPNMVNDLIFVDAAIYVTESVPSWLVELPQMDRLGPSFAGYLAKSDSFYESIYLDDSILTEEKMYQNKIMTNIENWNLAFWEYLKAWGVDPSDSKSSLAQINQKCLVISGDADSIVPLEQSQKLASELPNATLSVIENCGHMPQEEKTEEFISVLEEWFDR